MNFNRKYRKQYPNLYQVAALAKKIDGRLVLPTKRPCYICKTLTNFYNLTNNRIVCSEECEAKVDTRIMKQEKRYVGETRR
jgi:hypothetical protein